MAFAEEVAKQFDFLIADYGFQRVGGTSVSAGEMVSYRKDPLELTIGWYKGEIDVGFSIALDYAASHKVFRPYLSRSFALHEIATRENPAAFASLSARMRPLGFVTSVAIAAAYLDEAAKIVKRFCEPILRGDFAQLEKITVQRQGETK